MIAYKLMRLRKDGTLGSLFIGAKDVLRIGKWMWAKDRPTDGYAHRPGWHCMFTPHAPHLSMKGRVWVRVEVAYWVEKERPESQGGSWILAKRMRIMDIVDKEADDG